LREGEVEGIDREEGMEMGAGNGLSGMEIVQFNFVY